MEIDVPLRIVILAPGILFFVTMAWSFIFRGHLTHRILNEAIPKRAGKVVDIVDWHFMESLLAEATIVFLLNGLTILLILEDQISGGIQMIVGVVFSITLLSYLLTSEHKMSPGRFVMAFTLLLGFVVGQLFFLGLYGLAPPWFGWLMFVFMVGSNAIFGIWVSRRFRKQR